ncbi:aminotransferase class III-fold pyridoxal phosphate-dependent enzyme [bacterium]|nr:aminotransferase class III-fold pyridoxal phosphate-dependent enzyme [bacterium]
MAHDPKASLKKLDTLRNNSGPAKTTGLRDKVVETFLDRDDTLVTAVDRALERAESLGDEELALLKMDETELCELLQERYVNFYPHSGRNPYVPLAAKGPWIVTTHGAVLHDSGGYGMLGLGHAPDELVDGLGEPWVMANVMTPTLSQKRFSDRLMEEIGRKRGQCPFYKFLCLNSGSEAVTLSSRIADIHANNQISKGAPHEGKAVRVLALEDGFHGRTYQAARISHSTRDAYEENLASFRLDQQVDFVPINDEAALRKAFEDADAKNVYYQALYIEPVMGEGIPGQGVERSFYDLCREMTRQHDSLLVVDSIQAALRAHGCLSIVDYPGFENCEAPDMETYSKALNAGQFPLSVLAVNERTAGIYQTGVYGNTMTTNPRALEVGVRVLEAIDDPMRWNIQARGREFLEKLETVHKDFPGSIKQIIGTGLLVAALLDEEKHPVTGEGGVEEYMRVNGVEMIHGGPNGLRFTPHFRITSEEIDLIIDVMREALRQNYGS